MVYSLTKEEGLSTVSFTILGEPASKANSRRLVYFGKRPMFIKSQKAIDYTNSFRSQCPNLDVLISGDVIVTLHIWYASRRPDLDESIILDAMQGLIYVNDRQVKVKHVYWNLDKHNPRSEICVQEIHQVSPDGKRRGHEEEQEDGDRRSQVARRGKRKGNNG